MGNNITWKITCNHSIVTTLHALDTRSVSGILLGWVRGGGDNFNGKY
jgi:hypothetical protein